MKIYIILLFIEGNLISMEDRPHYRLNNKIVYFKESHESGNLPTGNSTTITSQNTDTPEQDFQTVSDFNKSIEQQNAIMTEVKESPKVHLNVITSNKFKLIAAVITGTCTVAAAIISSLVTYYSKKS